MREREKKRAYDSDPGKGRAEGGRAAIDQKLLETKELKRREESITISGRTNIYRRRQLTAPRAEPGAVRKEAIRVPDAFIDALTFHGRQWVTQDAVIRLGGRDLGWCAV